MMESAFAGRVAVVTGSVSGLGRAVAKRLVALDSPVGVTDVQNVQAAAGGLGAEVGTVREVSATDKGRMTRR